MPTEARAGDPVPPLERRAILVTGKGGVGKTSFARGLARWAAAQGRRPLVVGMGGTGPARPEPMASAGPDAGVHRVRLDVDLALEGFVARRLLGGRVPGLVRRGGRSLLRSAHHGVIGRLLAAAPGVPEVLAIDSLLGWVDRSAPVWSPVVVDLESTGHALMLFDAPSVLGPLVGVGARAGSGAGDVGELLQRFAKWVRDPMQVTTCVVATPESLVVEETRELLTGLADRGLAVGPLVVNRMPPALPAQVAIRPGVDDGPDPSPAWALALRMQRRRAAAERALRELSASVRAPVIPIEDAWVESPQDAADRVVAALKRRATGPATGPS